MLRRFFCKLILVAVTVFSFLAFSGVLSAQGRSEEALEHAKAVQERHTEALMAKPGVVGTAVGLNDQGRHVVMVLLEKSGVPGIPQKLEDVPVRPVVTGKIYARVDPAARFSRPVPTGVSTGHPNITAGTIACRVTDGTNVFALSNNHVYANENKAQIGDSALQPGPYDGGSDPVDKIGALYDFEEIQFAKGWRIPKNTIDAAIAISSKVQLGTATPPDGYGIPNSLPRTASIGLAVQKYGRTTGLSNGNVTYLNATVDVSYGLGKVARFVKQIIIEPGSFSAGGDSGSLIVTDDGNCYPIGLLFAGSDTMTIANPIDAVLSRFNVSIDDSSSSPPTQTTGYISGTVTRSSDGAAIFGASISTNTGQSTTTSSDGSYTLLDVPTGNRLVTASANGFESQTKTATVYEDQTTNVGFVLVPIQSGGNLNVDVSTDKDTYTIGERVLIAVTVTAVDGSGIEGAVVDVQISTSTGKLYGGEATTNSAGEVVFNFKIKKPDGIGDYDVDANASKSGYDPASDSTIFSVVN